MRSFSPAELKRKLHDSRLFSALIGVRITAWATFWGSLIGTGLLFHFPLDLPEAYQNKVKYFQAELEKQKQEEHDTSTQQEQQPKIRPDPRWSAFKYIAIQYCFVPVGLAAYGALVVSIVALPVGAVLGLVARRSFRRAVAKLLPIH